ncbi:DEAD/DEAH box helicase [Aliifodinibius salicampi]|uniref:DEAD/DEAH box helicase n=1 Tax=Fodinibius salicampi TaxID=1920655 RepID=A0ABT3Q2H1_9BACT|nr:DEAD/DEAH box helicase [Fodinibius salicampi]MCW9714317.1 DEAD/DEAH box helicase [Fodinibius salicampi]
MKFEDIKLSPNIMSGLQDVNYTELTELQEKALPKILEGSDALIKAAPGKSKNATFVIPALAKIDGKEEVEGTTTLILTPNSDEAQQIDELVWAAGYHAQVECASIDLDGSEEEQKASLNDAPQVIVANPGPLLSVMQDLRFIFRHIDYLVIDELDKLASLNLIPKVKNILKRVLSEHQTLIFTSELTDEVEAFAKDNLEDGIAIGFDENGVPPMLDKPPTVPQDISQGYIYVPNRMKITTLMAHIEESPNERAIIFTASKRGTDRLYKVLRKNNFKSTSLHDKLSDEKRAQRFANFTNGDVQFLLVGDLSATTMDIDNVKQVINYDVPEDPDEYRYRANLVSRGKASRIVSLVSKQDRNDINKLESELGQSPKELDLPEKVQQKLEERRKKKKESNNRRNGNKQKKQQQKKKKKEMELPRPSYEKLSGGKTGGDKKKDKKSGVIDMLKNLFS